ncbi:ATP-binding protein, partial [Pseudactinotalea sp.]|uniref:ATP-binding protein n=1 Tax=Pseudactinotalea sp. TaxID=1926260 RepID=UPI003B3B2CA1
ALREWPVAWSVRAYDDVDVAVCRDEAERLEALRIDVAELYPTAEVQRGRHLDVLPELAALARLHPLRESMPAQLMRALHQAGRRHEALEVYQSTRSNLVRDLGLEPSDTLAAVQSLVHTGATVDRSWQVPAQLPAAVDVVGREDDVRALDALAREDDDGPQVAVLCGPAGVGKSALALSWAQAHRGEFPDGQLFVDLQGYSAGAPLSPEHALTRFVRTLGGEPERLHDLNERAATYRSLLADRRLLVVLDNARDVEQVRPLLPGSPGCRVLVTSRDSLAGLSVRENALRVTLSGLDGPTAVSLLTGPADQRTIDGVADAAWHELARRCAYMPLMLKVAGERVREDPAVLSSLADPELDSAILDLWDLGDPSSSAREVLSWSRRAVPEEAATVFTALGLARSSTIAHDAVAALAGLDARAATRALAALSRAHLAEIDGAWVRQHDLVAAYAGELAEALSSAQQRVARTRLVDRYAEIVVDAIAVLEEGGESERFVSPDAARDWLNAALEPLVAAVEHAPPEADESIVLISRRLPLFLLRGGHHTVGRMLHEAALRAAERLDDPGATASALTALGSIAARRGELEAAQRHLTAAMQHAEASDNPLKMAVACNSLGIFFERTGRLQAAADAHRSSAHWCEVAQDSSRGALARGNVAFMLARLGRLEEAEPELVRQVEGLVNDSAGHMGRLPSALSSLAWLRMLQGQPEEAITTANRALRSAVDLGAETIEAECDWVVGMSELQRHDLPAALDAFTRSVEKSRRFHDDDQLARSLTGLATATAETDSDAAIQLLDDAVARSRRVGMTENEARALAVRATLLRGRGSVAEATSDDARSRRLLAQCGLAQA